MGKRSPTTFCAGFLTVVWLPAAGNAASDPRARLALGVNPALPLLGRFLMSPSPFGSQFGRTKVIEARVEPF